MFVCSTISGPNTINYSLQSAFALCPETFEVCEDCIGLYATERTNANRLTKLIKDVLLRSSLLLSRCRGQCYDGAANMSGRRSGVATQIQLEEPRAIAWDTHSISPYKILAVL